MTIAAAVLAGGKASRFGEIAKGLLPGDGDIPIIQRLTGEIAAAGIDEIVLVANDPRPYSFLERTIIPDLHPGIGPMAGVESALHHLADRYESVLFLPCDMPNISAAEIAALLKAHAAAPHSIIVAEGEDLQQYPLCAVVPAGNLASVVEAVNSGRYGVGRLWRMLGLVPVCIDDPMRLFDLDTPEDFDCWRQTGRQKVEYD